jgi:molecular chaperone DnaK (HSP70)
MRNTFFRVAMSGIFMPGFTGTLMAWQDTVSAQNHGFHAPRTIDRELNRLIKELELTPAQQKKIRPLLLQHQQEIQTLIDKNPSALHEALNTQIHGISDQTHRKIDALLTDHQKQLAEAMQAHMRNSENRPPS